MARTRRNKSTSSSSQQPLPLLSIGNCKVEVRGSGVNCDSRNRDSLEISVSKPAKIKISVEDVDTLAGNQSFMIINPKDVDSMSKSLLQEVLRIYVKELPAMNFAANTGKESQFLEKCVLNGKYCTLLLKSNAIEAPEAVLAAVSYQIIPADMQYAEIPLAAVSSDYQHKGFGCLLYMELRKRLQNVGVRTIFCWADKESEGFWLKQGFIAIAEVDSKGKARRLPIKADIRKALCFPGGSTLMVSHLNKDISIPSNPSNYSKMSLPLKAHTKSPASKTDKSREMEISGKFVDNRDNSSSKEIKDLNVTSSPIQKTGPRVSSTDDAGSSPRSNSTEDCEIYGSSNGVDSNNKAICLGVAGHQEEDVNGKNCSSSCQGIKRRVWQASQSSLKSKKVKGGHHVDSQLDSCWDLNFEAGQSTDSCLRACSLRTPRDEPSTEVKDSFNTHFQANRAEDSGTVPLTTDHDKETSPKESHRVMLMNIADEAKKASLTKIIEALGGVVTSDGSVTTHVITGKARRTLNFCTALCSGAWIVSADWLKASCRDGRFVGESPFVLKDEEYLLKYGYELKEAVLRAQAHPRGLLKGYDFCLAKHVQPPVDVLSAIIKSAGGNVLRGLNKVQQPSKAIFIACEQDMEEALKAADKELWTYSSDWFMNCVMKQVLDLQAPQFTESL